MNKIINIFNDMILQYQEEICKKNPSISVKQLQEIWEKKYPLAVNPWIKNWENIKTFFKFSEPIRKIIYTTNAVESLHRQFRKVTKTRAVFPCNESLNKLLFLAIRSISRKWTMPIRDWKTALSQFAILYGERMQIDNHL